MEREKANKNNKQFFVSPVKLQSEVTRFCNGNDDMLNVFYKCVLMLYNIERWN